MDRGKVVLLSVLVLIDSVGMGAARGVDVSDLDLIWTESRTASASSELT